LSSLFVGARPRQRRNPYSIFALASSL